MDIIRYLNGDEFLINEGIPKNDVQSKLTSK
jgi:hypothetical protein